MKKTNLIAFAFGIILMSVIAYAGAVKTWTTNERLKAADLNSNFSHVHTASERIIVNADVSAAAAISHSKLATPALIPKAWAGSAAVCTTGTCVLTQSSQVSKIDFVSAGTYDVTLSYVPASADFMVQAVCGSAAAGEYCFCTAYGKAVLPPHFRMQCFGAGSTFAPALSNQAPGFVLFDTANY